MHRIELPAFERFFKGIDEVDAAWLFGSSANGIARAGHDIDIGVLFREDPSLDFLAKTREGLQGVTRWDDVDVIVLNRASPHLRFEAIKGIRLFCREVERCAAVVSLWAREYEDEMGMLEKAVRLRRP